MSSDGRPDVEEDHHGATKEAENFYILVNLEAGDVLSHTKLSTVTNEKENCTTKMLLYHSTEYYSTHPNYLIILFIMFIVSRRRAPAVNG